MIINHNDTICYVSKSDTPLKVWYHINVDLKIYCENYIEEKLGITDPKLQRNLQEEFYKAVELYRNQKSALSDTHYLYFHGSDWAFYLNDKTRDSVTVYVERSFYSLMPDQPNGMKRSPGGGPYATIYKSNSPEIIQEKLYDTDLEFPIALYEELHKIMNW